jgi:hypothetical protein
VSAFYSVCYDDRVELLTDGAVYLPDGTLVDIREKVWRSPSLPLAVTGRGSMAFEAFAETILTMSEDTVDAVLERTRTLLEEAKGVILSAPCEVLLAGISEARGPSVAFFTTANVYPQYEPWTLYDVGPDFGGGNALTEEEVTRLPSADNGLAECGVALFEAMRSKPGLNPAAPHLPEIYGIGGHVDLTIINADGATTTRLHTWPDVVGQKIDPLAAGTTFSDGSTFSDGTTFD